MAKDALLTEQRQEATAPAPPPAAKSFPVKKVLVFGIPVFLVQVILLYFLATKFIFPPGTTQAAEESPARAAEKTEEPVRQVYVVSDLIVNPAGTNGTRFLLTTIGIEVDSQQARMELEKKDIQVRDALISILTSKGLDQLVRVEQREALRGEIASKIGEILRSGKPKSVYFGKFIIQ